jgi:hypothetical protein
MFYEGTKAGFEERIINFSIPSMFFYNDPIMIIVRRSIGRGVFATRDETEKKLLENINNLIEEVEKTGQEMDISQFSGLTNARDKDWGTLKNYGESLIPRSEWRHGGTYYGFETEDDYQFLVKEIIEYITHAIHHTWANRFYLIIRDRSHRLAALYRQSINQNRSTKLNLNIYERKLNIDCVRVLFNDFFGILTTGNTYYFLAGILNSANIKIFFERTPHEDEGICVLWIEKTDNELLSNIIDFIKHLPHDRCFLINCFFEKFITFNSC